MKKYTGNISPYICLTYKKGDVRDVGREIERLVGGVGRFRHNDRYDSLPTILSCFKFLSNFNNRLGSFVKRPSCVDSNNLL